MKDADEKALAKEAWRVFGRLKQILMEIYAADGEASHAAKCALCEIESVLPDLDEHA